MDKLYKEEFEFSKKEILANLEYLEKNALTVEQLNRMNKTRRMFYKANKLENKSNDILFHNGINYA